MNFFMAMIPPTVTQQEHKVKVIGGKPRFYESQELKTARLKLRDNLAKHVPSSMFECPVSLTVKWLFYSEDESKDGTYRDTKPDTDNLQKMLKDEMTYLKFWKDDCLVVSEHVEKFWSSIPGIYICIKKIDQ